MFDISVKSPNSEKYKRAFKKAPFKTVRLVNKALQASLAEVQKRETDSHFKFKTPLYARTGELQSQFIAETARKMSLLVRNKTLLSTEVYSTVNYADYVNKDNPFYQRILDASESDINRHFKTQLNKLSKYIKDETR